MTERLGALQSALGRPVPIAGLVFFRFLFGMIGFVSALRFLAYGWVDEFFVRPRFFFKYGFAPFVEPLSHTGMHAVFWVMAASGLAVALGLFYRAAVATFFVTITYVQLIDVTNYLNHYYLVSLLAALLFFVPAAGAYSIDAWRRGVKTLTLPRWGYSLLRFQVGVVYTFAGVAKIGSDWLLFGQPLDIWLSSRTDLPVLGPLLALPAAPMVMSWAGCLFDLTIALWLSLDRTRPFAFVAVLVFHAVTMALFPIGMFPVIMVVSATIFFRPDWPQRVLGHLARLRSAPSVALPTVGESSEVAPRPLPRLALAAMAAYAAVQLLVPLRSHLYGGDVLWHEQGMRFSWRVMVREKNATVTYLVTDPRTGRRYEVAPRRYLDARQEREFATQPDLILALAHRVAADEAAARGGPVEVRADVLASLNGRRAARLVDPTIDLAAERDTFAPKRWVLPAPSAHPRSYHRGTWPRRSWNEPLAR
jgi:vitamin K-dependent gamma-carboxylase